MLEHKCIFLFFLDFVHSIVLSFKVIFIFNKFCEFRTDNIIASDCFVHFKCIKQLAQEIS